MRRAAATDATDDAAEEARRLAHEEILIAEGSDWFWWYGDENSSGFDEEWDALFRSHLANACAASGLEVPAFLRRRIGRDRVAADAQPRASLPVRIDGRAAFFEWLDAGRLATEESGGAIARAGESRVEEIRFGFSSRDGSLCLRIDARGGPAAVLGGDRSIAIVFSSPEDRRIVVALAADGGAAASDPSVAVAADVTIEIAVPADAIGRVAPGDEIRFRIELREGDRPVESVPGIEDIALRAAGAGTGERELWP